MGAETTVYAKVLKSHEEWIEVPAVTLDEAAKAAYCQERVIAVLHVQYEKPDDAQV